MHPRVVFSLPQGSENSTVRYHASQTTRSRMLSRSTMLTALRVSMNSSEFAWTPDPFDVARVVVSTVEPRLKHSACLCRHGRQGITTSGRVIRGLFDTPQVAGGDSFTAAWGRSKTRHHWINL